MSEADDEKRTNLRPAQVTASTLAAVTGAFLAARIGVYGTVIGVGVMSLLSTIGSEFYLRSLERTKAAAMARSKVVPAGWAVPQQRTWPPSVGGESEDTGVLAEDTGALAEDTAELTDDTGHLRGAAASDGEETARFAGEQPGSTEDTVHLPGGTVDSAEDSVYYPGTTGHSAEETVYLPDETRQTADDSTWPEAGEPTEAAASSQASGLSRLRRLRWPVIVAGSVAAFVLAMIAVTGIEAITGSRLSGGEGSTIGTVIAPDRSSEPGQEQPDEEPTDREPQEAPVPEPDSTAPDEDPGPAPEPPQPGSEDGTEPPEEATPPTDDDPPAEDEGTGQDGGQDP